MKRIFETEAAKERFNLNQITDKLIQRLPGDSRTLYNDLIRAIGSPTVYFNDKKQKLPEPKLV